MCLTARTPLHGRGKTGLRPLARLCAPGSPAAGGGTLTALRTAGRLDTLRVNSTGKQPAACRLGEIARRLVPVCGASPAQSAICANAPAGAFALADRAHSHGRRHGRPAPLSAALAFHARQSLPRFPSGNELAQFLTAVRQEGRLEIIDDAGQPVRPGHRYRGHLAVAKAEARKRYALSPRRDAPRAAARCPAAPGAGIWLVPGARAILDPGSV
ncbi:hypothetical protein [Streptomyces sp. NPDC047000]|uniref:hypothetical protein n=1 Tax=Streptomyces sp. NPDC047000 TaxID=3155474 RepID=UPI00340777F0